MLTALSLWNDHCLEKNPAQRFQSASDVAFNLEALSDVTTTSKVGVIAPTAPAQSWLRPGLAILLLIAACTGTYFLAALRRGVSAPSFHRLTYRRGSIASARFSPDGQTIVYGAALEGRRVELLQPDLTAPIHARWNWERRNCYRFPAMGSWSYF